MEISEKLNEKYGKEHLSYSSLKIALSDMARFDMYMRGDLKFESDALSFGTLYDMLLFEPKKASEHKHPRRVWALFISGACPNPERPRSC